MAEPDPTSDHERASQEAEAPEQQEAVDAPAAGDGESGAASSTWSPRGRTATIVAIALICALAGIAASLVVARSIVRKDEATAHARFRTGTAAIASSATAAIQREQDLTIAASTFFAGDPNATAAEFSAWATWAHALRRNAALQRLALVRMVPASRLRSFAARGDGQPASQEVASRAEASQAAAQPAAGAAAAVQPGAGAPEIVPAGSRPYYCLASAVLGRGRAPDLPATLDLCARDHSLIVAREAGIAITKPFGGRDGLLRVQTPVYRGGATPSAQAARSGAFVGWLIAVLRPRALARAALAGHPDYAVRLHVATTTIAVGSTSRPGQAETVALPGRWRLQSFGPSASATLLADGRAAWALGAGGLASLLAGLAILSLGTRRLKRSRGDKPPTIAEPRPEPDAEPLYDALTGLPNRGLTLDRAGRILARAGRQSGIVAGALLIDIDWFADVNEKLGRDAGDQLLKIVAQRLEGAMRAQDTIGRLGGDQFVVLVESAARGIRMDALAQRVIEALHKPVELEGFGPSFFMTASIGVAFGRYEAPEDLLRDADLALRSAKAAGKDRYTLFNANMRSVIEGRGVLEAELNGALQDGQLFLVYEPIYDLSTRLVAGVEALLRWRHPQRGVLPAEEFTPLAEESGLIVPIGRFALQEACNRAAAWEVEGHRIGVCVKVSESQLNRDGFLTDVRRALQQSGLQAGLLTLEVAETAVMREVAQAEQRLREIKQLGVRVAIDDFGGSGYAYHSDLRRLPLDCLRVDRGSLAVSDDEEYRNWLLEAILIVGRELSLAVVAKGVSSQEQVSALQAMGCTMAQGLFMGEPISAEGVLSLLGADPPASPQTPHPLVPQSPAALLGPAAGQAPA